MSEELSQGTSTTTTTESAGAAAAAPAPSAAASPASTQAAAAPAVGADGTAVAAPAWTPNWEYDFNGKKKTVDEFFRPLAKDEASLTRLRDSVKKMEQVEVLNKDLKSWRDSARSYEPQVKFFDKLRGWYAEGNHDRVMRELGYGEEQLLDMAHSILERRKADPAVQRAYQEKTQAELAHEQLLQQNESYKSQALENLAKVTNLELESELGKADIQPMVQAYEKVHGVGSFRDLVLDQGSVLVERAGKHIPPSELVGIVAKQFSPFLQAQHSPGTAAADAQGTNPQNPQIQTPAKKAVIPVIKGTGSPTKGGVRSLDDLRKLAKTM